MQTEGGGWRIDKSHFRSHLVSNQVSFPKWLTNLGKVPGKITMLFLLVHPLSAFLETSVQTLSKKYIEVQKMIQICHWHERLEWCPKLGKMLPNSSLWEASLLATWPWITLHHYNNKMIAHEFPKRPLGLVTTTPEDHLATLENLSQVTRWGRIPTRPLRFPAPSV